MVLFWPILAPKCEVPKLNTPKYVTLQKLTAKIEHCKLKSEKIRKIWKKSKLKSEKIWTIWKKGKLNCEKDMENTEEK
jgi:hypothetical protein